MSPLLDQLRQFTRRVRAVLVVERVSQAVAGLIGAGTVLVLLDLALRLPTAVRLLEVTLLCAGLAAWVWRRVVPAVRFNPPLVEVALRLERSREQGRALLASATEFAQAQGDGPWQRETIEEAARLAPQMVAGRVDTRAARRALGAAAAACMVCAALVALDPGMAAIGARRLLSPLSGAEWPARHMVEAAMAARVHPRGTALPLRATVVRGDAAGMRAVAEYRVVRDGRGEWDTVALAPQPDGSLERLVETDGEAIEVVFRTSDMQTEPVRIELVQPPGVRSAVARVTPPAYAADEVDVREIDLGTGTDRRATVSPPVLEGSEIEVRLALDATEPLPTEGADRDAAIRRAVRLAGAEGNEATIGAGVEVTEPAPGEWVIRWRASGQGVLEVSPEGRAGMRPVERIAFEIPSIPDQPPVIAVTEPAGDETVTEAATPLLVAEGRDDLRVAKVWIEAVRAERRSRPAEQMARVEGTPGPAVRVETSLSLRGHGLLPGDSVVVTAYAADAHEADGVKRAEVASAPRVLRIIGEAELTEQVRSRLGQMRDAAARLREEQQGIRDAAEQAERDTARDGQQATQNTRAQLAGAQGRLMDRIGAFERALNELGGRLERNTTDGDGLRDSIESAVSQAREAAAEAQEAAAALPQQDGAERGARHAAAAERALAELETALERDRAGAQIARRIDALREKMSEAQAATRALEGQTVGKPASELSAAERQAIEQAAQAQREAAADARALTDQLDQAAKDAETAERPEPGASEAFRQAAREAEERGLARQIEQAAEETQANRMQGAQQAQQQAQQTLDAMRQALRDQQRARSEDLRRRMASLVESLRSLLGGIGSAQGELLAAGDQAGALESVAKGVLALSRNAVSVSQEAAEGGARLTRVAELADRAGTQLDEGATMLRAQPAEVPAAGESVEGARRSVADALAAAQAIERRSNAEAESRRRSELRDLYTQVLDRQRSARTSTEAVLPPPGRPLERRALIESRRIAAEQSSVSAMLQAISTRPDVTGSELYSAAQAELQSAATMAGADLSNGMPSRRTVLMQTQVERGAAALVEALADPEQPDDPFAREERQGGEQAGGEGQQGDAAQVQRMPPIAELKLIRTMAQQALDDTRAAAELPEAERGPFLSRVANRQRTLLELGEKWMERMKRENAGDAEGKPAGPGGPPPAPPTPGAEVAPLGAQASPASPPAPTPPAPPKPAPAPTPAPTAPASPTSPTPPPAAPPAADEPSLDRALGLDEPGDAPADAEQRRLELERGLRQEKPRDLLASALQDLRVSAELLAQAQPGLDTQRLQENAVRKFDELIATARRMQQEQQSAAQQQKQQGSRSQRGNQQGEQSPQDGEGQRPEPQGSQASQGRQRGDQRGDQAGEQAGQPDSRLVDPTDQMAEFDESRIAWGQLPPRVREAVRQGLRDPVSAAYRKMTQDYYRRLAEEQKK